MRTRILNLIGEMKTIYDSYIDGDVILAAVIVIPATTTWILSENTTLAVIVGTSMFLLYIAIIPKIQSGELTLQSIRTLYLSIRDLVKTHHIKSI